MLGLGELLSFSLNSVTRRLKRMERLNISTQQQVRCAYCFIIYDICLSSRIMQLSHLFIYQPLKCLKLKALYNNERYGCVGRDIVMRLVLSRYSSSSKLHIHNFTFSLLCKMCSGTSRRRYTYVKLQWTLYAFNPSDFVLFRYRRPYANKTAMKRRAMHITYFKR